MTTATTTRDKLIDGMRASLRTRGYGSTSMKDLLAGTGVSSGSMYHSFPGGKEELAATTIREVGLEGAKLIRNVFSDSASVGEGLATIFGALRRDLEQSDFGNGCPIGVPATEAVGVSDQIQEASREVFEAWVAAYRDALVNEGWSTSDATPLAIVIVTAYEGSLTIARAMRSTAPIADAAAHLTARVNKT
ncbi:MAG: TetR/AcrR family transcriptional regulator [Myxococcota bacterium]